MNTKLDCNGLWWTPGGHKLLGTLTFRENDGGILSVFGDFPESSDKNEYRHRYPIILGETESEEFITLQNCSLISSDSYIKVLRKTKVKVETIFVGYHFEREESIQFDKFSIKFSNLEKILKPISRDKFSSSKWTKIIELPIKNICNIRIFTRSHLSKDENSKKISTILENNFEIISFEEKTFDKYRVLYNTMIDFFNFFLCDDVDIVSVFGTHGVSGNMHEPKGHINKVQILYRYPIMSETNKPLNNINFYMERKYCLFIPYLLFKWFDLQHKFESVYNLYFAVMFSGSDTFLEFQFLALAQALEVYHTMRIGGSSTYRKERENDVKKIRQLIEEKLPEKQKWVDDMLSNSVNPSLQERLTELYNLYTDFCYAYLKFNNKENLVKKIKNNRDYFTHWASTLKKKSVSDNDLFWLIKDTQFLLRLCLLSELGVDMNGLRLIFDIDKMLEARKKENEDKRENV